jgi:hypothetical protein
MGRVHGKWVCGSILAERANLFEPLGVLYRKNRELSPGAQVFLKLLAAELGGG